MQIKKLKYLEGVFDTDKAQDPDEQFDSDVTITTAELSRMIPEILDALGGEQSEAGPDPHRASAVSLH